MIIILGYHSSHHQYYHQHNNKNLSLSLMIITYHYYHFCLLSWIFGMEVSYQVSSKVQIQGQLSPKSPHIARWSHRAWCCWKSSLVQRRNWMLAPSMANSLRTDQVHGGPLGKSPRNQRFNRTLIHKWGIVGIVHYHLVICYIAMENHHFSWEKPR